MRINMNYKYIEQLLDRYFDCLTTLEEEQILRSFFSQEDVPAHLMQYRDIFVFEAKEKNEVLGEEFDAFILSKIQEEEKTSLKSRIISIRHQLSPLFRAAAIVAVIVSVGNIAEHSMVNQPKADATGNATAISPYIKAVDVESAVQIKDVSRAEATTPTDSIPQIQSENDATMR